MGVARSTRDLLKIDSKGEEVRSFLIFYSINFFFCLLLLESSIILEFHPPLYALNTLFAKLISLIPISKLLTTSFLYYPPITFSLFSLKLGPIPSIEVYTFTKLKSHLFPFVFFCIINSSSNFCDYLNSVKT